MGAEEIHFWESLILEKTVLAIPKTKVNAVKDDPDDNKFIEAALEGKADYIISQDKHLLKLKEFRKIKIIIPDEFVKLLE